MLISTPIFHTSPNSHLSYNSTVSSFSYSGPRTSVRLAQRVDSFDLVLSFFVQSVEPLLGIRNKDKINLNIIGFTIIAYTAIQNVYTLYDHRIIIRIPLLV